MIGGNVREFVDNLYYGSEMYFIHKEKKYFIQGWYEKPTHFLVLDYEYEVEPYDAQNPACDKNIWEYASEGASECVKAFWAAPLIIFSWHTAQNDR